MDKSIAENIVGITKFFFIIMKINIQLIRTIKRIMISASAKTPAGKIVILPSKAARVE